jgi:hypothetical protein
MQWRLSATVHGGQKKGWSEERVDDVRSVDYESTNARIHFARTRNA